MQTCAKSVPKPCVRCVPKENRLTPANPIVWTKRKWAKQNGYWINFRKPAHIATMCSSEIQFSLNTSWPFSRKEKLKSIFRPFLFEHALYFLREQKKGFRKKVTKENTTESCYFYLLEDIGNAGNDHSPLYHTTRSSYEQTEMTWLTRRTQQFQCNIFVILHATLYLLD